MQGIAMNRKDRKARGIKGKKGDRAVITQALSLARDLLRAKKNEEAITLYKQILEFDPDNEIALADVGIDHYNKKHMTQAEKIFDKVLRLNHKNLAAIVMLATIRMDQNRVAEALDLVARAERLGVPDSMMARVGVLYRDTGQLEKANHYIELALKHNPEDITALYTLQSLRKFTPEELARLEKISKAETNIENKTRLEFTLGKACLDNAEVTKGFWHFAEANLLKRASMKYSIEGIEEFLDSIPRHFNKEFIDKFRGAIKNRGGNNIFIIGMPRSGSTLVDQIISSHPLVTSVGESPFLTKSIPVRVKLDPNNEMSREAITTMNSKLIMEKIVAECSPRVLQEIGDIYEGFIEPFTKHQKIVVDKMLFNFIWVGMMRLALPDAKIIHCVRDPIDIGLSIWQLMFTDDIPWAYDQREIGRYYLAYHRLMEYWRQAFPGEFFENHYEDMVNDQEGQSRRVIEFCGLPWHDDCLKFYENKRRVKTASVTQVRKPMYKDSVKKWKKYEKQMKLLIDTVEAGAPGSTTDGGRYTTLQ